MATPFVTGPAHMFVGTTRVTNGVPQGAGVVFYLGTSEGSPDIDIKPVYEPVYNDLSGSTPFDLSYMGEEAYITADLTRWNEAVYAAIQARPRHSLAGGGNIR